MESARKAFLVTYEQIPEIKIFHLTAQLKDSPAFHSALVRFIYSLVFPLDSSF
jgi:hypothetical protein